MTKPGEGVRLLMICVYVLGWVTLTTIVGARTNSAFTFVVTFAAFPVLVHLLLPPFRWPAYQLLDILSVTKDPNKNPSVIGTNMKFELEDGTLTRGTILDISATLNWYIVRGEDGKRYVIALAWKQPVWGKRYVVHEETTFIRS